MGRRAQSEEFHFEGFEYPTTTPVPDVIFDAFLSRLGEAELKALLYIVRRTFGFKKDRDAISFNQFLRGIKTREGQVLDEGCGVKDRTTLSRALQSLEAKGIIRSEKGIDARGENETTVYSLRFKGDVPPAVTAPAPAPEVVGNSYHPSRGAPVGVVGNSYHGGRETPREVVGIPYHRGRENPPGVVGIPYPQQTVIQETEGQDHSNIRKDAQIFFAVDNSVDNFVDDIETDFVVESSQHSGDPDTAAVVMCEEKANPDEGTHRACVTERQAPLSCVSNALPVADTPAQTPRGSMPAHVAEAEQPGFVLPAVPPPTQARRRQTPRSAAGATPDQAMLPGPALLPVCHRASARSDADADHEVGYDPARDLLARFVEDFAREFNDQAPLRSTLSRLANLYQRSALPMDAFVAHLYAARQTTQERTGAIRTRAGEGSTKNKMVYFFGVLENRLDLRDHAESSDLAAMFSRSGA